MKRKTLPAEAGRAEGGRTLDPIISIRGLKKTYHVGEERVHALNGVDLDIYPGEFVCIIGRSGSGKSTLLNMMAGLEKPTRGSIVIAGEHLEKMNEKQLVNFRLEHIGFIFQQFNLLSVLTAQENIIMPLLLDRQQPDNAYLQEIVAFLGIDSRLTHLPHELSGGQQQRVAIARALITKPDIIFADEPTGNLDSKSGGEVMKMLCDLRAKMKKTLIVITHDPHIAEMAERRFTIIDGVLSEVTVR